MKLDKIITLANQNSKVRFLAMERSLRATGCDLPLWVIPYDDKLFDLPENAIWWRVDEVLDWLKSYDAHPMMRKYQCLLTENYQFIDSDVIFLKNPINVLKQFSGFITSCGHWKATDGTLTVQSKMLLTSLTTNWQRNVFNAGQFACDKALFSFNQLKELAEKNDETCLRFKFHDQPGLNLLVNLSKYPIVNLTLPPWNMESTWAGDYLDEYFEKFWTDDTVKPYLIHWAGHSHNYFFPIHKLVEQYLTSDEKSELISQIDESKYKTSKFYMKIRRNASRIYQVLKNLEW